jgi:hypothetical protein
LTRLAGHDYYHAPFASTEVEDFVSRGRVMKHSILPWLLVAALAPGCAAIKATQQPSKKDLGVLTMGMPRTHVIAELGAPIWSDERDGDIVDVFAFRQGYSKGCKASRALVHGAADVATFGLWEVVGIPAEALADGTDVRLEVHYDPHQAVRSIEVIKGESAFQPPKLASWWQRRKAAPSQSAEATDAETEVATEDASAEDAPVRR